MTTRPVAVISTLPEQLEPVAALIEAAGVATRRLPADPDFVWTPDTISTHIADADALVGIFGGAPLTRSVLEGAPRLRTVTSPIIGTETIDVDACTDLGIVVGFGATEENYVGVAEAVVMLVAALRKQLPQKMAAAVDGTWRPSSGVGNMVRGSVVGLVGYGAIGRSTAARLAGWDCRLVAHDPYVRPDVAERDGVELMGLHDLLGIADVVSLMVTLTSETRGMLGAAEIARMKRGAYLVNTARGGLVDETALLAALESGHLAGAAVDTWDDEGPSSTSPLRGHPRVIATGHDVGHSVELYRGHPIAARDNTLNALQGHPPLHIRNPAVLPAWTDRIARLEVDRPLAEASWRRPQEET